MNKKIHLPENYTRALSSCLLLVEKSLIELKELMLKQNDACCNDVVKDIDDDAIANNISIIQEAKTEICKLADKYSTSKDIQYLQRIIIAKRTMIWIILTDSLPKNLKGFSKFPQEFVDEYSSDIENLIEITKRINY